MLEGGGGEAAPSLCLRPQDRYYVLYVRPSRIHRRKFDPKGNEIEPNFSATRKVNTGFLMSSYSRYLPSFLPKSLLTLWPFCPLVPTECLLSVVGLEAHVWPEGHVAGLLPAPIALRGSPGPGGPSTSG